MKKVAIIQSNYVPWRGYFGIIASVDEFILYDEMQYTRRDWRNRNRIKTNQGSCWLTIPVDVKGKFHQRICETKVAGQNWRKQHWQTIVQSYGKSKYFSDVSGWLEPLYLSSDAFMLSEINKQFINAICCYLNITTYISQSSDYDLVDGKSERLADLCRQAGAQVYMSGPAARGYIDEAVFQKENIHLQWADYSYMKPYEQLWGDFDPHVSILDLLFNCGRAAIDYLKLESE
ncbi:hypothetical protein WH43_10205 [Rheinheimera sp. KL1]|uniref:WbqC family protein n=1 Tax=Rheinheimera sp. KL1 TaxID=1635005 RepID=UPI0006A990E3|nr:WbqC family protein [Rheinheimera sp. KL1]KOO58151.1 hypothetical protein WH43_10205 [Rheinheimera sp. KL1]